MIKKNNYLAFNTLILFLIFIFCCNTENKSENYISEVQIIEPIHNSSFAENTLITFKAFALDNNGNEIEDTGENYTWFSNLAEKQNNNYGLSIIGKGKTLNLNNLSTGPITYDSEKDSYSSLNHIIFLQVKYKNSFKTVQVKIWIINGIAKPIYDLETNGSDLYIGGSFTIAGNFYTNNIFKWNSITNEISLLDYGVAFSEITNSNNSTESETKSKVVTIASSGSKVYVGGFFNTAGEKMTNNIAMWNGSKWESLGNGINGHVTTIITNENIIYASGLFTKAGNVNANNIAKWNGSKWESLGSGIDLSLDSNFIGSMAVDGNDLYVGGNFYKAGNVNVSNLAKWNGTNWENFQGGVTGQSEIVNSIVIDKNKNIYIGGGFFKAGITDCSMFAMWDGTNWKSLGKFNNYVYDIYYYSDENELYVGGVFSELSGFQAKGIAKYNINNQSWKRLNNIDFYSDFIPYISSIEKINNNYYFSGEFHRINMRPVKNITKWDGENWEAMGFFHSNLNMQ